MPINKAKRKKCFKKIQYKGVTHWKGTKSDSKKLQIVTNSYYTMKVSNVFLYTILVFAFTSCIFHPYTWQGTNPPGKNKASFKDFRGKNTNSIEVSKGNLLLVSYHIEVTQGILLFSIENKRNKLFQKSFSAQSDTADLKFSADETGLYKIVVQGKNATGSFDINYKAEAPKK